MEAEMSSDYLTFIYQTV